MPFAISIIKEEKNLHAKIHYFNKDIVDTNYTFF